MTLSKTYMLSVIMLYVINAKCYNEPIMLSVVGPSFFLSFFSALSLVIGSKL